jgi:hypothetical protein
VSSEFLDTLYLADTLIGGPGVSEALVANFNAVDCYTLVDYVEALARIRDQNSFKNTLARIRYTGVNVYYFIRRHFFSIWFAKSPYNARDITPIIIPDYKVSEKKLNRKSDGIEYIPGLVFYT